MGNEVVTPNKGPWNQGEDGSLKAIVASMPSGGDHDGSYWVKVAAQMGIRSAKQCRERWHQSLKPGLNHGPITPQEADLIVHHVQTYGPQWAKIARDLPGRSDNMIKNWWNGSANRREKERQASLSVSQTYVALPPARRTTEPYMFVADYRQAPMPLYPQHPMQQHPDHRQQQFHRHTMPQGQTDTRRMTVHHPGYHQPPYPPPAHQPQLPAPPAEDQSRGGAVSGQEHDTKKLMLPSIHNLFTQPSHESAPRVSHPPPPPQYPSYPPHPSHHPGSHQYQSHAYSHHPHYPHSFSPTAVVRNTPQGSPTDAVSPVHEMKRESSTPCYHTPISRHPVHHSVHHARHREVTPRPNLSHAAALKTRGNPPPALNTHITSPPTEIPSLDSEGASESPSVASPITPAYPSFPSTSRPERPQERSDGSDPIGNNTGPGSSGRAVLAGQTQIESPRAAAKRGRDDEEVKSPQVDGESRAKRHCGGKMDLKVLTN